MKRQKTTTMGIVSRGKLDSLISKTKTVIDRFYQHYDELTCAFNSKLLDDRILVSYKRTVDRANKWIKEARITRSFVSVDSCKYLRGIHRMVNHIIRESFAELGRNAAAAETNEERNH